MLVTLLLVTFRVPLLLVLENVIPVMGMLHWVPGVMPPVVTWAAVPTLTLLFKFDPVDGFAIVKLLVEPVLVPAVMALTGSEKVIIRFPAALVPDPVLVYDKVKVIRLTVAVLLVLST